MKKFLDRMENVVEELQQPLAVLSPGIVRLPRSKVMFRAEAVKVRDRQVAIISGGGSGHDPAHAGFTSAGVMSAAVVGELSTSPDTDSVVAAIKAVSGKRGALLVEKKYTGDQLNFGLAVEIARSEAIAVDMIVVDDHVALNGDASGQ